MEFKRFIGIVLGAFLISMLGYGAIKSIHSSLSKDPYKEERVIVLTPKNHIVIRGEVSELSMWKAARELITLDGTAAPGMELYIYLDTPGGDVAAGISFISVMRSMGHKVHTISKFAASMGFVIAQHSENRYVTFDGVLMSHRPSGGISGEFYGNFHTRLAFWESVFDKIDTHIADRMGLMLSDYRQLVRDEWWAIGFDNVDKNAADEVVGVTCSKLLIEQSACPL